MNFRRLAINVKFLTAGPTGVHRVAEQLINQVAENLHEFTDLFQKGPELVAPANLSRTTYNIFNVERRGWFRGQLWEQFDLPRLTRPDLLLNLCNLGPMSATSAITMIHDAQVFSSPGSYKPSSAVTFSSTARSSDLRCSSRSERRSSNALDIAKYQHDTV